MHEGIAKMLETRWRSELEYMSPIMETILSGALKNNYRVELKDMMPSLAKLKTAEDVQLAYAEVSTMMEYLASQKGIKIFSQLLDDLSRGKTFDESFLARVGTGLASFQNKWETWAKKKELRYLKIYLERKK